RVVEEERLVRIAAFRVTLEAVGDVEAQVAEAVDVLRLRRQVAELAGLPQATATRIVRHEVGEAVAARQALIVAGVRAGRNAHSPRGGARRGAGTDVAREELRRTAVAPSTRIAGTDPIAVLSIRDLDRVGLRCLDVEVGVVPLRGAIAEAERDRALGRVAVGI